MREKIQSILQQNRVVLFMKGTPQYPLCGFSARACAILDDLDVPFHGVNVLEDEALRAGIKEFGNWPTIPQLYVNQKLVGGSDIMTEMYQTGELQELVK
ncbi:MAG: Grx4 family monothiol glutaredoxin [Bdellovibrionaceae bacterium]|nr:Grx4 family monothiol glutaredoxin [Pseudobdellovibrionaceae bacterium]